MRFHPVIVAVAMALPSTMLPAEQVTGLERAIAFYNARPRVERPQAGWQGVPEGLLDLRAATCGECHPEIYDEWRVSTHALALT